MHLQPTSLSMLDPVEGRMWCLSSGVPAEEQRLTFGGQQLADSAVLAECGVTDEATLYSLARLLGGGKKRKKKTYTKPKKIKHKHKKIKLRVLKFYKVGALLHGIAILVPGPQSSLNHPFQHKTLLTWLSSWHHEPILHPCIGGRLGQGAAAAQGVPSTHLRPWYLHGHPLQPRVLVRAH